MLGLVASSWEADAMLDVVFLDEVLEDSAGLPECQAGVGIVDRGYTPIGVDGKEVGFLQVGELRVLEVIGQVEFFAEHADFWGVGAVLAVDGDGLEGAVGRHGEWIGLDLWALMVGDGGSCDCDCGLELCW